MIAPRMKRVQKNSIRATMKWRMLILRVLLISDTPLKLRKPKLIENKRGKENDFFCIYHEV